MKTKKLLSLLVAASMLPTMAAFNVSAQSTESYKGDYLAQPSGWNVSYESKNATWNNKQDYAGITLNEGIGGGSAVVVNVQSPRENHRFINLSTSLSSTLENGSTYRISFWAKGLNSEVSTNINWNYVSSISEYTKGTTSGEFTNYYKDITVGADNLNTLLFIFEYKINCVIDNVSVQKVVDGAVDGTELVSNGTFEKYAYNFNTPYDAPHSFSGNWQVLPGSKAITPEKHYIVPTTMSRTGEYALYMNCSHGWVGEDYLRLSNTNAITLEKDNDYIMEFWGKTSSAMSLEAYAGVIWVSNFYTQIKNFDRVENGENGWTKYRKVFHYTGNNTTAKTFGFLVEMWSSFAIDDVVLVKDADKDGVIDADETNMIEDGGFENSTTKGKVKENKYSFTNLKHEYGGNVPEADRDVKYYAEPTTDEVRSGNYGLHIVSNGAGNNIYTTIYQNEGTFEAGKKYTITFYAKGTTNGDVATWFGRWQPVYMHDTSKFTKTGPDADGWYKYTCTTTLSQNMTGWSILLNKASNLYFDDFTITDETGKNLAIGGDFEGVTVKSTYSSEITHLMAYPVTKGGGLNVSWINPASNLIKDIDVYVDGKAVNNNAYNLTAGAFNQMYVDGLTNNQEYDIEVKVTLKDEVVSAQTTGTPDNKGAVVKWGDWTINRFNRDKDGFPIYSNYNTKIDNSEYHSGSGSFKMDINLPTRVDNLYPNISQVVTAKKADEHTFKMWAKTENIGELFVIADYRFKDSEGVSHNTWTTLYPVRGNNTTDTGWTEYTYYLGTSTPLTCCLNHNCNAVFYDDLGEDETEQTVTLYIATDMGTGSIWIDDVQFYASHPVTHEALESNQIRNGSFDDTYTILKPEFTDAAGKSIEKLVAGDVNVTAKIKNNTLADGLNAFVAIALYNGGRLENVTTMERKIEANSMVIPADEFTAKITVPDLSTGEYSIKILYWNGTETIKPIGAYDEITE